VGILEVTIDRVGTLERRMNEHDAGHIRIERRLDQLAGDVAELKTDVAELKIDVGELKSDMAQVKARVEVIPELQAGQIELREMVAKLLARSETSGSGS
jgi:chromosome segregation ATPase